MALIESLAVIGLFSGNQPAIINWLDDNDDKVKIASKLPVTLVC